MNKIDWNEAPEWADKLMKNIETGESCWADDVKYQYIDSEGALEFKNTKFPFSLTEYRPDAWKEGERRMSNIAQNGNDGHYEELDNLEKQPRYTDENGLDWIDEFAANNSIDDFRAAMRFTIGKYERRLGKKDELSKELYKISDYYQRWSKVEKELEQAK